MKIVLKAFCSHLQREQFSGQTGEKEDSLFLTRFKILTEKYFRVIPEIELAFTAMSVSIN